MEMAGGPEPGLGMAGRGAGRLMGLDIGQRRIGVAASDPLGFMASPQAAIEVGADQGLGEACAWVERLQAVGVIVGYPLLMSGEEGEEAQRVRAWAERLRERVRVPVELWDERFSTAAAERALLESGMRREKRRHHRDAIAAALILQSYMDAHQGPTTPGTAAP